MIKENADSILAANKYLIQEKRNSNQELINKKQLDAIQLQAFTAKQQYETQLSVNKSLINQNRPVFMLIESSYDTLLNIASFEIKNVGKRPAKIINSQIFFLTKQSLAGGNQDIVSRTDLNEATQTAIRFKSQKSDFLDGKTQFYIYLKYLDAEFNTPQIFVKYFYWQRRADKVVGWNDLENSEVETLKVVARRYNLSLESRD